MKRRFKIEGRDGRGELVTLELAAESFSEAVELGRAMGLSEAGASEIQEPPRPAMRRVSREEFIRFNRELADVADTGMPLPEGLRALARGLGKGALQASILEIATDVERGAPVAAAVQRYGRVFPPYYAELMEAAVASGDLGGMLRSFADYSESVSRLRAAIWRAVAYPAIVFVVGLLAILFIEVFLVSQFARMYEEFDLQVGAQVRAQVAISRALATAWVPIVLTVVALALFFVFAGMSPALARARRAIGRRIPMLRKVLIDGALSRLFAGVSIGLKQGLSMQAALGVGSLACGDSRLSRAASRIRGRIEKGQSFCEAAREEPEVPSVATWMMGLGEEEGRAGTNAQELSRLFRSRAEVAGEVFGTAAALATMVAASALVGFAVSALFSPLITLMNSLGGA
ncbi:MAG: type II secretion system F family protein [Planctomycetota bacterium]